MAETLYADGTVSGSASTPANAHGAADGTFTTDTGNTNWTHRWSLDNLVGTLDGAAVVQIVVRAQKESSGGNDPSLDSITLYDGATSVGSDATGWTITSATGQDITVNITPSPSITNNGANLAVEIATTGAGGPPASRRAVQIDSITTTVVNATNDRTAQIAWAEFETPDPPLPDFIRGWERGVETVSTTTITINKPTGTVENDIMYAFIMHESGTMISDTPPSGWTDVGTVPIIDGTGNAYGYKKVATASEPASYDFTFDPSNQMTGYIVTVKNTYTEDTFAQGLYSDPDSDQDIEVTLSSMSTAATALLAFTAQDPVTPLTDYFASTSGMTKRDETSDAYLGATTAWYTEEVSGLSSTTEVFTFLDPGGADVAAELISFIPSSTDRAAILAWAELEIPTAPRTAQISWAELELPDGARTAQIAWAELEIPTAPRRARIAWAEMEMGDAPRRAQISWAEFETPQPPKRARISWAELELPDGARAAQVSWAELEIPTAPRRARISWAELETTDPPRRARVSWTELEFGDPPRTAQLAWAELEIPTAPRRAQIAWTELELPTAPRRARLAWTELETPSVTRAVRLTWAELETPSAPRAARLAWTEMEINDAPRNARVSWAEMELPDGARAAQVAWTELELPDAPRRTRLAWAELELPSAPRRARISWAEVETPNQPNRKARLVWTEMQLPDAPGADTRSGSTRLMLRGHS